ncbi:MAG: hypothetical protein LBS80_02935 [Tannerella sp.]|jgi:hypothetical protein|nr:hypothetical protein [Tannerella sp.]
MMTQQSKHRTITNSVIDLFSADRFVLASENYSQGENEVKESKISWRTLPCKLLAVCVICCVSCNRHPRLIADDEKLIEITALSSNDTVITRFSPGANDIKYGFEG